MVKLKSMCILKIPELDNICVWPYSGLTAADIVLFKSTI